MKKNWYVKTEHSVSFLDYYFVFCPRYRRKIFAQKNVRDRFKVILQDVCHELGISISGLWFEKDYVAIHIKSIPKHSPLKIISRIKYVSSGALRKEFDNLNHLPSLWTRSFFVSNAETVSDNAIKKYIDEQKRQR
jgi:putative transposase